MVRRNVLVASCLGACLVVGCDRQQGGGEAAEGPILGLAHLGEGVTVDDRLDLDDDPTRTERGEARSRGELGTRHRAAIGLTEETAFFQDSQRVTCGDFSKGDEVVIISRPGEDWTNSTP
mgnify:CR=1 FL=1